MPHAAEELLAYTIARLVGDAAHVAVGAASPIPAAGVSLLRARHGRRPRISLLHRRRGNPFTDGSRELFDLAGQGRIDVFFLGGAQIDGEANINLVGTGAYPKADSRFPGSFGSAFMYFAVPRVILFRQEHSRRVLVPRVDFVSAPGWSPPHVVRPGGPQALLTGKALFAWQKDKRRFRLESVHRGHTVEEIRADTGFEFDCDDMRDVAHDTGVVPHDAGVVPHDTGVVPHDTGVVPITPEPDEASLALLRGPVAGELAVTYPGFARRVWGIGAAA